MRANTSLGVGYLGSHGYHEMLSVDANEPFPTLLNGALYYPSGAALANPNVNNTTTWLSEGVSDYNSLAVDVNHRFSDGFQIRGVYTFSKSLDDGTAWNSSVGANAPGFVMYPLESQAGLEPFDHRRAAHGGHQRRIRAALRPAKGARPKGGAERCWEAGRSAASRRSKAGSRSRRNWASTRPTTATAAIPSGHR